jgi:hypothetical protein
MTRIERLPFDHCGLWSSLVRGTGRRSYTFAVAAATPGAVASRFRDARSVCANHEPAEGDFERARAIDVPEQSPRIAARNHASDEEAASPVA